LINAFKNWGIRTDPLGCNLRQYPWGSTLPTTLSPGNSNTAFQAIDRTCADYGKPYPKLHTLETQKTNTEMLTKQTTPGSPWFVMPFTSSDRACVGPILTSRSRQGQDYKINETRNNGLKSLTAKSWNVDLFHCASRDDILAGYIDMQFAGTGIMPCSVDIITQVYICFCY